MIRPPSRTASVIGHIRWSAAEPLVRARQPLPDRTASDIVIGPFLQSPQPIRHGAARRHNNDGAAAILPLLLQDLHPV